MLPEMAAPWIIEQSVTGSVAPAWERAIRVSCRRNCFRLRRPGRWFWSALSTTRCGGACGRDRTRGSCAGLDVSERRAREDEVERVVEEWTRDRDADDAMTHCRAHGSPPEWCVRPRSRGRPASRGARVLATESDSPVLWSARHPGCPSARQPAPNRCGIPRPRWESINEAVLAIFWALPEELAAIAAKGVIGTRALPASRGMRSGTTRAPTECDGMNWQPEMDELRAARGVRPRDGRRRQGQAPARRRRLTVRERIDALVDGGSFREVGAISGKAEYDGAGDLVD